jgi:hypothetical protein
VLSAVLAGGPAARRDAAEPSLGHDYHQCKYEIDLKQAVLLWIACPLFSLEIGKLLNLRCR